MIWTMAWRNMWRQRRRSLVTASALAVGIALCMSVICFQDGFYETIREVMVEQRVGHLQLHHEDYPGREALHDTLTDAEERIASLKARPEVNRVAVRLKGQGLIGAEVTSQGGLMVGTVPSSESAFNRIDEMVVEGRYLAEEPAHEAVLGLDFAKTLELGVGDTVVIVTQASDGSMGNDVFTIVGMLTTGDQQLDTMGLHLHLRDLQELLVLPDQIHEIAVVTRPGFDLDQFANSLRAEPVGESASVRTWKEVDPDTASMLGMQDTAAWIMLIIVLSVASVVILNTMMMVVFERTYEIGLLKAVGMRPTTIVGLITFEALCLTTVGIGIGVAVGVLLDLYLINVGVDLIEEDLTFNGVKLSGRLFGRFRPGIVFQTVGIAYVVSLLATLWPAWRASRLQPVAAMRQD
jgi:ABC-type lipoprotein release transport system permease subunit